MAKESKGNRIPDKERQHIFRTYIELRNITQTAKRHGVSRTTVRKIIKEHDDVADKFQQKRKENTKSVLDFMDSRTEQVTDLVDKFLIAMEDEEKIDATSLPQLATAMGIVIDKFTMKERLGLEQEAEDKRRLRELQAMFGDKNEPK